jgi:hypothetical protein
VIVSGDPHPAPMSPLESAPVSGLSGAAAGSPGAFAGGATRSSAIHWPEKSGRDCAAAEATIPAARARTGKSAGRITSSLQSGVIDRYHD